MMLSEEERQRYARQLILPELGEAGQQRLKNARVLCVGAGGLGSAVLTYLTAAGVGTLGIVDEDQIELSNLQRQTLYQTADVNKAKVSVAKDRIQAMNPHITVNPYPTRLTAENASTLLEKYDIVADCTDNFASQYLINDYCVKLGKVNVSASIMGFKGQCNLFTPEGPCYRCLYPNPPETHQYADCNSAGVLGALVGMLGTLQATEIIKTILAIGDSLKGRLLTVDALELKFKEYAIMQDPDCVLCAKKGDITSFNQPNQGIKHMQDLITREELERLRAEQEDFILIDVRTHEEREAYHMGGIHIPLDELAKRVHELEKEKLIITYCRRGGRSEIALQILKQAGFAQVKSLAGGIQKNIAQS